ncbi:MAG: type II toxin-antitoxin system HipA family toxin [Pseudomonadota bacterium]
MPRPNATGSLLVSINGAPIGRLSKARSGAIAFTYDDAWLARETAFPVSLSLPLREDAYSGAPVIAVFDNLLPDNADIRRRLAERARALGTDAFSILSAVGRDCVGAMQFTPESDPPGRPGAPRGRTLSEADVANLIRGLTEKPLGTDVDEDFRISIAGAQEKTALLHVDGEWRAPIGASPTTHILKPQIGVLKNGIDLSHSVENEFLCLKLCEALGLKTADAEIADFEDERVLVVKRFDRLWTDDGRLLRVPQEDCCQALSVPPTLKYENEGGPGIVDLVALLKAGDLPEIDVATFLRAQIIFWAMGATDGHAKNFSVFLKPGGGFQLTPIYDVLTAQPQIEAGQIRLGQAKLAMAIGDKRRYRLDQIAPRHFQQTAKRAGVSETVISRIFEDLFARLDGLDSAMAAHDGVPGAEEFLATVTRQIRRRILLSTVNAE